MSEEHRPAAHRALPCFHATGGVGWINDPNGFSLYQGQIHLFFQYYPFDVKWGPMHWGHARTTDFIRWEYLPAALAPDQRYDKDGCFSGGSVRDPCGSLSAFALIRLNIERSRWAIRNSVCRASRAAAWI